MKTKTYALRGDTVDATYIIKTGKAKLRAHFQGGVPDERRRRPATLTTSDQVAMLIIETSALFKSGSIYVLSETIDEGEKEKMEKVTKKAAKAKKDEEKVYPDATSLGQAVNILTDLGASAENLMTPVDVLNTAAQMKVSFPNLSLK